MIEMESEAPTPMLRRYSIWIGDTARVTHSDMSSAAPAGSSAGMTGTGGALMSAITRKMLRM